MRRANDKEKRTEEREEGKVVWTRRSVWTEMLRQKE